MCDALPQISGETHSHKLRTAFKMKSPLLGVKSEQHTRLTPLPLVHLNVVY